MTGGAFSLSVADAWLDMAAVSGSGAASVLAGAATLASAGGPGNSWMICACQPCGWQAGGQASPHPGGPGCTAGSQATRRCNGRLARRVAGVAGRAVAAEATHESSEPSSAAFCSAVCATAGQHVTCSERAQRRGAGHVPEAMLPARDRVSLVVVWAAAR